LVKPRVGERGGIGDKEMAGGGAAASALSSPWRTLLQRALDANAHLRHSTFFQLVRFDRLFAVLRIGENEVRSQLSIRFRQRWAPAAGRRTAPSCSGALERVVLRPSSLCLQFVLPVLI
jgi:hypothetical protein